MNLRPVLGCSLGMLSTILKPYAIGMDEQGPVTPEGIHDIPYVWAIVSIGVVLSVELSIEVRPLERVLPLYQWSGISVGDLHKMLNADSSAS